MILDDQRGITATNLLAVRRARLDGFPTDLFGEAGWEMLLNLYCCGLGRQRMTAPALLELVGTRSVSGSYWIKHLAGLGLVEIDDGGFIELSAKATLAMERFLDAVPEHHDYADYHGGQRSGENPSTINSIVDGLPASRIRGTSPTDQPIIKSKEV